MYAIIDLEWTSWKNSNARKRNFSWEIKEIIQIGVIKFEKDKKNIRIKNLIIKPIYNSKLSFYIQKLTGINQFNLNARSINLKTAIMQLNIFFRGTKKIYCNGLDKEVLEENCKLNKISRPLFTNKIINIRPQISKILKKNSQEIISSELNEQIGLKPLKKHLATDDCINILNFIRKFNLS
jgi:inhibitor of KinA sporulation pathway (predicted exonuclease)